MCTKLRCAKRNAEMRIDMLIGNHPHVIQKTRIENRKVVAYSLGSFNQSPSADYIIHDALPEYSMALHVYFSKDRD